MVLKFKYTRKLINNHIFNLFVNLIVKFPYSTSIETSSFLQDTNNLIIRVKISLKKKFNFFKLNIDS